MKTRWHLFEDYKMFRMGVQKDGKWFYLGLVLEPSFEMSNRWADAFMKRYQEEVEAGHWDHHHGPGLQMVS